MCLHKQAPCTDKVENKFTRLLQNTGKMSLLLPAYMPVDQQYHKQHSFIKGQRLKGEWLMHLPPGSSAQMINHDSMTTEVFVNWLLHFSY